MWQTKDKRHDRCKEEARRQRQRTGRDELRRCKALPGAPGEVAAGSGLPTEVPARAADAGGGGGGGGGAISVSGCGRALSFSSKMRSSFCAIKTMS